MSVIVNRLNRWLQHHGEGSRQARRILSELVEPSEVELTPLEKVSAHQGVTMKASLLDTTAEHVVIGLPHGGTQRFTLTTNELLRLTVLVQHRPMSGQCRVLGRVRIVNDDGTKTLGYRLAMPDGLKSVERTEADEKAIPDSTVIEATFHTLDETTPVHGVAVALTGTDMQLRTRNARDDMKSGVRGLLKIEMPHPIGDLDVEASVIGIQSADANGLSTVDLRFVRPVEALQEWCERRKRRGVST